MSNLKFSLTRNSTLATVSNGLNFLYKSSKLKINRGFLIRKAYYRPQIINISQINVMQDCWKLTSQSLHVCKKRIFVKRTIGPKCPGCEVCRTFAKTKGKFVSLKLGLVLNQFGKLFICVSNVFCFFGTSFKVVWNTLQYFQRWQDSKKWLQPRFQNLYHLSPKCIYKIPQER